jgi:hypothetical protein
MVLFAFDGLSISKLLITSLLWLSVSISIYCFIKSYKKTKLLIPKYAFRILLLIIVVNLIAIIKSLLFDDRAITTLFGNVYTSLALLSPFCIIFSFEKTNLSRLHKYFIFSLKAGIVFFITFFVISSGLNIQQLRVLNELMLPVIFLITIIIIIPKSSKYLIFVSVLMLFYVAFIMSNRTMIIREVILLVLMLFLYSMKYFKTKMSLRIFFLSLSIPIYLLINSISSGQSAIEQNLSSISDQDLSSDTRTFLYTEVFEDLLINDALIFGKGANGTYYSNFFNQTGGDTDTRLTVEVGMLSVLLKTGLVGVILYFLLILNAVYHSLFKSRNLFVKGIGLMLGIHFILLFVENIISYSSYNIYIWFFIGICLSKEMRNMSNPEIKALLLSKKV